MLESSNPHDTFNRTINYVRLSITEVCNFRCAYCLPKGYQRSQHNHTPLSLDEIYNFSQAFANIGIQKIRLTGGEPLVNQKLGSIIEIIKSTGIKHVALTTNAYRLYKVYPSLVQAGLDAINISLDSLDAKVFYKLTGHDKMSEVLKGIEYALNSPLNVKINVVSLQEINDNIAPFLKWVQDKSLTVRFIELMPTDPYFFKKHYVSTKSYEKELKKNGWTMISRNLTSGPAREYQHPNFKGKIGFITPLQNHFCNTCNRLRLTSYGELMPCLFGKIKIDLRKYCMDIPLLQHKILSLIHNKPEQHSLLQGKLNHTKTLSSIGG